MRDLESELNLLVAEGFNTILLLVPWAQFQNSVNPISYTHVYFERLDAIFEAADARDMQVVLRIGYLWESVSVLDPTYQRYREYFQREDLQQAWRAFNARIYKHVNAKRNFAFGFLSWEDFYWPILVWGGAGTREQRVERGRLLGFRDYVRRYFSLGGVRRIYGLEVKDWNDLPIPTQADFAYELYLRFYEEELLARILSAAEETFPGIRYELRVDSDWIKTPNGRKFYHWSMNPWGLSAKVVYYHANIGQQSDANMNDKEALRHLESLLQSCVRNLETGEAKVFIDQFNFFDNTYAKWSTIDDSSVPAFLRQSKRVLRKYTEGYAVWGYRDWRKDTLYNGSFELGDEGWSLEGGADLRQIDPSKAGGSLVHLKAGGSIRQSGIVLRLPENETKKVRLEGHAAVSSRVCVVAENQRQEVNLEPGPVDRTLEFDRRPVTKLGVELLSGEIAIHKLQLFDRVYSQGLRTVIGESTSASTALGELNFQMLAEGEV